MSERKLAAGAVPFETTGSGPSLVLFHSLIADRSSFAQVAPLFAKHFTVAVATLPGFCGTERVDGGLPRVADTMAEAIHKIAGDERPVLLGNGYGGFVALQLAIRHPGLISRLVLTDAGACFSEPGREAFRVMARAAETKGMEAVADTAMRRLFARDFMASNPVLVAECRRRFVTIDKDTFVAACLALAELDLRPYLGEVSIPVLAVVGGQDEATPPDMSREIVAALPRAELAILPDCAHVPQLQSPKQFLETVLPFMRMSELSHGSTLLPEHPI